MISRVFQPSRPDTSLAIIMDLPDDDLPDHDLWKHRRMMAAAWVREAKPIRLLGAGLRLQPSSADSDQLNLFSFTEDLAGRD
mgnify:CR=1 FL=1